MSSPNAIPLPKKRKYTRHKDTGARLGVRSPDKRFDALDRRCKYGRILKAVTDGLVEHLGGAPTFAEELIIHSAAVKSCKLAILSETLLDGVEKPADGHHVLAWMEALRRDLLALGLKRVVKAKSFEHIIDEIRAKKDADDAS